MPRQTNTHPWLQIYGPYSPVNNIVLNPDVGDLGGTSLSMSSAVGLQVGSRGLQT